MKIWQPPEDNSGFQLTPMIDVVFLLIIFFMTVASMITADKKPVNLAVAEQASINKNITSRFTFTIDAVGHLYAGPVRTDFSKVEGQLFQIAKKSPGAKIIVRADKQTEHRHINRFIQLCADFGFTDILISAYQSDI